MLWMITKFIFCLLAAGALGFIAGWVLSSLIKNEKLEDKFSQIKEDFDTKRAELNQAYSDLDAKDHELELSQNNIQLMQKEILMKNMDIEEYQKNGFITHDATELELENNTLKEEISEYKYLENENELLHNELKELDLEKEKLIHELEMYRNDAPKIPIAETAAANSESLKETHIISLQKDLKKAKKRMNKMRTYLNSIAPSNKKEKKEKSPKKDESKIIFGFKNEPTKSNEKKTFKQKKDK